MRIMWLRRGTTAAACLIALAGLAWLFLGPVSIWVAGARVAQLPPAEQTAALNAVRGQVIQLVGVLGGLVTVGYGVFKYFLERAKQRLDEDKHVTDRFSNAVGHLGSADVTVRAGGARTLQRIMADSPRDHEAVVDTLCGALRHWAVPMADSAEVSERLRDDVAAVVSALRGRPRRPEADPLDLTGLHLAGANLRGTMLGEAELIGTDLSGADLRRADLTGACLRTARLTGAKLADAGLQGAVLSEATLAAADLSRACLSSARLDNTLLEGADLSDADLSGADLRRARLRDMVLTRTQLGNADLTDADLRGADLRTAIGVTASGIAVAITNGDTLLPDSAVVSRNPPLSL